MDSNEAKEAVVTTPPNGVLRTLKLLSLYFSLYFVGIATFLLIIFEPFTMNTYFSDNSLLPGLVNREFSLDIEAGYYYKDLLKLSKISHIGVASSLATSPAVVEFIKQEFDNFGLDISEQNFSYNNDKKFNGTNLYSILRGERSSSAESVVICAPYRVNPQSNTLASVSLVMAMAKYFSTKSYWAKDVIVLFVDHEEAGVSAWLDSYYDINFRSDLNRHGHNKDGIYYDPLPDRSGPIQAAIVLDLHGTQFSKINVKIQGMYGQLPNLDLFNLIVELSSRESVTPYLYDKSLPFDLTTEELYRHHFESAMAFIKNQATMKSDGLHGYFLQYAIQSLTLEGPEFKAEGGDKSRMLTASLLNIGRLVEGVFRSLNNLTERFNRSYYFYIILALRRFTSIGYYMIAFGFIVSPTLLKAYIIHNEEKSNRPFIRLRTILLLGPALVLSLLSTFNISSALIASTITVPILLLI